LAADELRSVALALKGQLENAVIVLSSVVESKVILICSVSSELNKLGVKAGELVKIGSAILGGGGGGKDDFAQGGGVDSAKISEAFQEIEKTISSKIK